MISFMDAGPEVLEERAAARAKDGRGVDLEVAGHLYLCAACGWRQKAEGMPGHERAEMLRRGERSARQASVCAERLADALCAESVQTKAVL